MHSQLDSQLDANKILTIGDVLNILNSEVEKNPKAINYQLATNDYDGFSPSCLHFIIGVKSLDIVKRPKDSKKKSLGVDDGLTSKKILIVS